MLILIYRIHNLSGVTTWHRQEFNEDGTSRAWRGQDLTTWLENLQRPWVDGVKVLDTALTTR